MSRPPLLRLGLSLILCFFGCDKGSEDTTPPAVTDEGGTQNAAIAPTHEVDLPTPDEVCEHIVAISHQELGHLDEMDPAGEAAALAECVDRVRQDRTTYGVAFATIPECTFAAVTLQEIAECEDHYARDLVGDDLHKAITELSLEEPIVDSELCMHWAHIATGKAVDTAECRGELVKVREHVGNVLFDNFAKCMMDSKDEAEFYDCRSQADDQAADVQKAEADTRTVIPDATVADAIEALVDLERAACACESRECAHEARDALDTWAVAYREVGGSEAQLRQAEALVASYVQCERQLVGAHWVED